MFAIFKREIKAYFTSVMIYIYFAIFILFTTMFFIETSLKPGTAILSETFSALFQCMIILVPLLTMRMFSEERRVKTDQLLLTSPVKLRDVVMGKYCAAMFVFLLTALLTLVFTVIMAGFSAVEWPFYFCNLTGLILVGSTFISIGLFISTLTESQIVAALITIAALFGWTIIEYFTSFNIPAVTKVVTYLSINVNYYDFTQGIYNIPSIVFFLSFSAAFLFLTLRGLEKRRWS